MSCLEPIGKMAKVADLDQTVLPSLHWHICPYLSNDDADYSVLLLFQQHLSFGGSRNLIIKGFVH